jgi:hypothetical protein
MIYKLYKVKLVNASYAECNGQEWWSMTHMAEANNGRDDHEILREAAIEIDDSLWELALNMENDALFCSKIEGVENVPASAINSSNKGLQGFKFLPQGSEDALDLRKTFNEKFSEELSLISDYC